MRDEKDELFVGGAHSVDALLEHFPNRIIELWYTGEDRGRRGDLIGRATELDTVDQTVVNSKKRERFKSISAEANHQGIALLIKPQSYADWNSLIDDSAALILAFDQVTDPKESGSLISRT